MGAKILCTQADKCVGFGDKNTLNLCGACKTHEGQSQFIE